MAGECINSGNVLFVRQKHFACINPQLEMGLSEKEDSYSITMTAKAFAKYVELQLKEADCRFSDNYFDLSAGQLKTIEIAKSSLPEKLDLAQLEKQLVVRSLFDTV